MRSLITKLWPYGFFWFVFLLSAWAGLKAVETQMQVQKYAKSEFCSVHSCSYKRGGNEDENLIRKVRACLEVILINLPHFRCGSVLFPRKIKKMVLSKPTNLPQTESSSWKSLISRPWRLHQNYRTLKALSPMKSSSCFLNRNLRHREDLQVSRCLFWYFTATIIWLFPIKCSQQPKQISCQFSVKTCG